MHRNLQIFFISFLHLHQLTKYFDEEEGINCDSDSTVYLQCLNSFSVH